MKYKEGYKGKGMCKHCTERYWSQLINKYWCTYYHLSIQAAIHICKGIIELTDEKQKANG